MLAMSFCFPLWSEGWTLNILLSRKSWAGALGRRGSVGQRHSLLRLGWVGSHGLALALPTGCLSTAGDQTMMGRRWTAPTSWGR